jgi:hypothetical protein
MAAWLLAGCTTVHHHHPPAEPTAAAGQCDPVGRWTIGDDVFEIARTAGGELHIRNAAENEDTSVQAQDDGGGCKIIIQVILNEVAAGSGDFIRRTYELTERNGTVEGSLHICDFGGDFDGSDMATATCPAEDVSTDRVSGTRSPL